MLGARFIPTGIKHLTVTALLPNGLDPIEITTHRIPTVHGKNELQVAQSIETDLRYRDFTANAIAINLRDGTIVDPFGGIADIKNKLIRGVDSAKDRFSEDPLRILRMVRFACSLGFKIDANTLKSAKFCVPLLKSISMERIRDEFSKILISSNTKQGFELLKELNIFPLIFPELQDCVGFEQNRFHKADVYYHTLEVIENTENDLTLRLSALLHDIGKPPSLSVSEDGERHFYRHESIGADMTKVILERFLYPSKLVSAVQTLVATHMRPIDAGAGGLRRLLRDTGEHYNLWRKLKEADALACKLDEEIFLKKLEVFDEKIADLKAQPDVSPLKNLAVNGQDIMDSLKIPPSREVGNILRALHEKVLDQPELNEKEALLELAKNIL